MGFFSKEKFISYLSNVWFLWALCLTINIITFLFIYFKIHPGDKTLALHYNILVGVEWYGKGKNLYFIPGVSLAISAINFTFFKALKNSAIFFSALCIFASLCVQITLLAAVLFLSKVN